MSERAIPREVHIAYVIDRRTGGTHNVLEVCSKDRGVRFVMAQDSEMAKERDKYKLRAHLQEQRIAKLEAENKRLREALKEVVTISDRKHDAWDRAKAALEEKL